MEDDDLKMGMFDNPSLKLNLSNLEDVDIPEDEIVEDEFLVDDPQEEIKEAVEEDIPEDVDGEDVDEDNELDDEGKSSSNLYSSLTKVIHEQGLLPSLDVDTKIESIDDFVNVWKKEQDLQLKARLDEYIENLDLTQIAQSKSNIMELESIDPDSLKDNIDLAKKLIAADYSNQGLDEKKLARYMRRLNELSDEAIVEDAMDSLDSLKEFDKKQIELQKESYEKAQIQMKADQEATDKKVKEAIYDRKDLIAGLKVNKALQDKVYKSINEIVGKSPEGNFENKFMKMRRENPIDFEVKMYHVFELTDGFTNLSKLSATAKSKAVSDLETAARKTITKDSGVPSWMQDSQSYSGKNLILNI